MEVKQKGLEIVVDTGHSIEELAQLSEAGISVIRTCHVGNLSAHNMALLDAGIPAWLVDYSKIGQDPNYQPENLMINGNAVQLAPVEGEVVKDVKLQDGRYLDEFHADAMRLAFPGTSVETASEYLQRHSDIASEIIEITAAEDSGGSDLTELDSCRLGTNGMLLVTFIAEALESQNAHQFHLGGSYLHRYIGRIASSLSERIDLVRRNSSFGADLPENITVSIVPTEHAVFATSASLVPSLEEVVEALTRFFEENELLASSRSAFFGQGREEEERLEFVSRMKERQQKTHDELGRVVAEHGYVITDRSSGSWISQHDVLDAGGFYSHPINRTLTMDDLKTFHQAFIKARRR